TPMVEEPLVVVLGLERLDLPLDEVVQLGEVIDEVLREVEVHGVSGGRRATSRLDGQALVENTPTVARTIECNTPVTSWRRGEIRGRWPLTAGHTTSIGGYSPPPRAGGGRAGAPARPRPRARR